MDRLEIHSDRAQKFGRRAKGPGSTPRQQQKRAASSKRFARCEARDSSAPALVGLQKCYCAVQCLSIWLRQVDDQRPNLSAAPANWRGHRDRCVLAMKVEESDIAVFTAIGPYEKEREEKSLDKAFTCGAPYDGTVASWALIHSFCEQQVHGWFRSLCSV